MATDHKGLARPGLALTVTHHVSSLRIPNGVAYREFDGQAVVLNLTTGMYYGLNPTATVAWTLLEQGRASAEIVSEIAARFDVSEATALADLNALVSDLASKGLLASD